MEQPSNGEQRTAAAAAEAIAAADAAKRAKRLKVRALIAYLILGVCNNYGYVVMLTAASDIIKNNEKDKDTTQSNSKNGHHCTYLSTGAILLADIVPSLFVKLLTPFIPLSVNAKVFTCVILAAAGYIAVAVSEIIAVSILGVVFTSFASGLGEVTFLQYSALYSKNVLSTFGSGTGVAGVVGALSYSLLQKLGIRTTLLIMLVIPGLMAIAFFCILPKPFVSKASDEKLELKEKLTIKEKLRLLPGLMKYMVPLGLVYFFEYFINQGTFELVDIKNSFVAEDNQYMWLQVCYQVGVFISRSSVNLLHIKHTWILAVLQLLNVVVYTSEVIIFYIPSFYIIIALTLWEGLLGGAAYVNTYYNIATDTPDEHKEFSLGITSFSDAIGISLAGLFSILAHNRICDYYQTL